MYLHTARGLERSTAVTHPTLKTHAQQPSIPAYMEAHPETEKRHLQEKTRNTN